jgi:pimeloyl-ACP methyl ester carboxylesterase
MKCDLGNIAVYYETIGEGNPFVTISGQPSAHQIIKSWMEPIFEKWPGWQRFYFDLPSTGQTPGADWINGSDQMLDVVCDFIHAVIPDQTFTLLGLSYGGYLARGVVYRKPEWVDGLCLLVPYLQDHDETELPQLVTFLKNPDMMAQLDPDDAEKLDGLTVIQTQKNRGLVS